MLDEHNGFTAVTLSPTYVKIVWDGQREREATNEDYQPTLVPTFRRWGKVMREHDTIWRPASRLKRGTIGTLDEFEEKSFYQNNNNVTIAYYKVPGYRFRIAVWFDNDTERRIA